MGQWLRLHASTVESPGSITGQGNRILQVVWCSQKKKKKEEEEKEHYSAFKKKKIQQFTAIWMDFEDTVLIETSQRANTTI